MAFGEFRRFWKPDITSVQAILQIEGIYALQDCGDAGTTYLKFSKLGGYHFAVGHHRLICNSYLQNQLSFEKHPCRK